MKKKLYQKHFLFRKQYNKFCNLEKRVRVLIQNGEYYQLSTNTRNRILRRLKLLYSRIVRLLNPGTKKLRWAAAAGAFILSVSVAHAGFNDPVSLKGIEAGTFVDLAFVDYDKDNDLDIVAGNYDGVIHYFQNNKGYYTELTGTDNPFDGIDIGSSSKPAFADVDKDGDLDLLIGASDGTVSFYRNNAGTFTLVSGVTSPFDGIDVGSNSNPVFGDVDGDNDPDLLIGGYDTIYYFQNEAGLFTQLIDNTNPFVNVDGTLLYYSPDLVDYDKDGDLDLFLGEKYGSIQYYENQIGVYNLQSGASNPFDGIDLGLWAIPSVSDVDLDGDLDLAAGNITDSIKYYENIEGSFDEKRGSGNPFKGIAISVAASAPTFGDIDNDGDLDLVIGNFTDSIYFYNNDEGDLIPVHGADNPFNGLVFGSASTPVLADLEGDGDLDLISGNISGTLQYFINDNGNYTELVGAGNPFNGIDVGSYSAPAICDFDGDGDLDVFIGNNSGLLQYYKNVTGVYIQQTGTNNPFDGIDFGSFIRPAFADIDGDADLDLIVGDDVSDNLKYFSNNSGVYEEQTGVDSPFNGFKINWPSLAFINSDGEDNLDLYLGAYNGQIYFSDYLQPGLNVIGGSGITTTEAGGSSVVAISLKSKPHQDVEIGIESSDLSEGIVDQPTINFTDVNWDIPQIVTITGVDDAADDGTITYSINFTVTSYDWEYKAITIPGVTANNFDDDGATAIDAPLSENAIKVYATDRTIVINAGNEMVDKVEIFDISGRVLISKTMNATGTFELSVVKQGIYFVRIASNNEIKTSKVLVQ
jgi:hypothetical protein